MTPQEIISAARVVLNDTDSGAFRYSDTDLLRYVNDAVKTAAIARPDWFTTIGVVACTLNTAAQYVSLTDAHALIDVISNSAGRAMVRFDYFAMTNFNPSWLTETSDVSTHWSQLPGDSMRFFVYPAPNVAQSVYVRYVKIPSSYGLSDDIAELPETVHPAVVDYVVAMAESRDDEHVVAQRSAQFLTQFISRMSGPKG